MKKLILTIFTIFLCLSLNGQDNSDPSLDLGDVIIEGESDLIRDSLKTNYDLDSLLNINNNEKFIYKPEPVVERSSDHDAFMSNRIFSLEAKAGNHFFGSIKAALSMNSIINFNFDLNNRSLKEDWNSFESSLNWIPNYREFQFNAGMEFLKYESDIITSDASNFNLGFQRTRSKVDESIDFPEFSFYGLFYKIDQQKTELNSFDLRSNINWRISRIGLDLNLEYLKENYQGDLTIFLEELPVNRLGLYLHYKPEMYDESGKIMVSVDFFNRINLLRSLFLNISNEPFLSKNSYLDDLKKDHYQEPVNNSTQFCVLINPEFSLEYFGPVYAKGSFQFSKINDFYFFVPDSSGMYKPLSYHDIDHQQLGFEISYKYGNFEIGNSLKYSTYKIIEKVKTLEYSNYEENVPFVPEISNLTFFELSCLAWKFRLENNYFAGREDELGEEMPDVDLLNVYLSYELFSNIDILGEVENILDERYRAGSYLPEEGFQFKIGFRWSY